MTVALQMVSEPARTRLVLAVSMDADRLLAHPVRSLLISPFVVPVWSGLLLLPLVVLAVGAVQRSWSAGRCLCPGCWDTCLSACSSPSCSSATTTHRTPPAQRMSG
ncbi:MAG: hypothetical protein JWM86_2993 [Thermoleophilia bacterium]|nr:hypothetical protein [Thermoleophilia bacterium]